jgi:hypothetical protein
MTSISSSVLRLLVTANIVPSSPIRVSLMMEVLRSGKCRFLQEPHGVTAQKRTFFAVIVTGNYQDRSYFIGNYHLGASYANCFM